MSLNLFLNNFKTSRYSVLILLIGLPASGKSVMAQKLKSELTNKHGLNKVYIIDTDIIRFRLFGADFCHTNEKSVVEEKNKEVSDKLNPGNIIIVDDLHYLTSMRHYFYDLCKKKGAIYIPIYLSTPMSQCKKWNKKRGLPIPHEIIEEIAAKIDIPGKKYQWDRTQLNFDLTSQKIDENVEESLQHIEEKLKNEFNVSSKNQFTFKNQTFNDQKIKDNSSFDKESRIIIHKIITKDYSDEILTKIGKYINFSSSNFTKQISSKRKKYVKWLIGQKSPHLTIEEFITFLTETNTKY
ncbi:AAA family ATPase [Promethearchaeum syntrophicum]|uniref:AAA family ATPase n=1 Tax=Promethearchaeum syntrophicum TaxID=2594042 RepID=A0A5B9DD47_9ARCH|nr:AAA family ATPase [Candidatus Prometheoarchaeum syntrophicum]QEE16690.1 L-seryl-tRNA(Sec) kinase [Candidatus Prometheoarchaeum syntrophicum]